MPPTTRASGNATLDALHALNEAHRNIIFPNMFNEVGFDDFAEVEYSIVKNGKTFKLKETRLWITHDRSDDEDFSIFPPKPQGKEFGKLVAPFLKKCHPRGKSGIQVGIHQDERG
jgi:hypothetical protein